MNSFRSGLVDPLPALTDRIGGTLELPVFFLAAAGASGTWTAPRDGTLLVYLWGAAGGGNFSDSGSQYGGGGGAALFKRQKVQKGQAIPYAVGVGGGRQTTGNFAGIAGGDTTATLLNGTTLRAGGGAGGGAVSGSPAAGGVAVNGDLNRAGGRGRYSSSAATAGEFGGAAGGSGGGAGGFTDLSFPIKPGTGRGEDQTDPSGLLAAYTAFPGGGGYGSRFSNYDTKGGNGALFFILE